MLELAVDHFAEAGKDELIDWKMGTSEDLGQLIYELVEEGSLVASDSDQQSDFQGWYDLAVDPAQWQLKW
ncbi:MAG: hypothetical protein CBB71_08645 [Rhodopirellula sp. TMED11]|nr:MAG: hypothetical protein CBB71_08645 [Rhodopirellula sp. TMED11]